MLRRDSNVLSQRHTPLEKIVLGTGERKSTMELPAMSQNFEEHGSEYYSHHGGLSLETYVEERYQQDPAESERTRRLIETIPEATSSLLDVGAQYGVFLHELMQQREIRCEGVDISQTCIDWGLARGVNLSLASADSLPHQDSSFDLVSCCEVLEHLNWQTYERALRELERVAKDWILISVPYDEKRNFARCPYCQASSNPNYHHRSFSPESLDNLFENFQLVKRDTIAQISVLTMLKPLLNAPWHSLMVCPSCGFRQSDEKSAVRDRRASRVKSWLRAIPLPRRPRWLVGLYRRA